MIIKTLKVGDIQANFDDDGDLVISSCGGRNVVIVTSTNVDEFLDDLNTLVSEVAE
jgi:Mg2+/Co2+ transporter CorC